MLNHDKISRTSLWTTIWDRFHDRFSVYYTNMKHFGRSVTVFSMSLHLCIQPAYSLTLSYGGHTMSILKTCLYLCRSFFRLHWMKFILHVKSCENYTLVITKSFPRPIFLPVDNDSMMTPLIKNGSQNDNLKQYLPVHPITNSSTLDQRHRFLSSFLTLKINLMEKLMLMTHVVDKHEMLSTSY